MRLKQPFYIEGNPYSLKELLIFCKDVQMDPEAPDWKKELMEFIGLFLDESAKDIVQYTSGTTGDPAEYLLNRQSMIRSAEKTIRYFNLKKGDSVLLCLPIRYIAGKMMVVRAMIGRLNLHLVEPSSRPLKAASLHDICFTAMVPLQVHESLNHGDDLSIIENLLIGGGEISPLLKDQLSKMEKPRIYESFAATETYTHFALRPLSSSASDSGFSVLDEVSVFQDDRGCLEVDVPGVTHGRISTNDLVEITPDGRSFKWLGRIDNVINSGGIKIIPEILEQKIREYLGKDCLVIPEKDARLGERVVLLIEIPDQSPPLESWMQVLREKLSPYELPARIIAVRKIPRNNSFKYDRKQATKLI